jgi:hypothetical protein
VREPKLHLTLVRLQTAPNHTGRAKKSKHKYFETAKSATEPEPTLTKRCDEHAHVARTAVAPRPIYHIF